MTHPNLKPGSPESAVLAVHDPSLGSPTSSDTDTSPTVALPIMADARAAANDDAAASLNAIRNPLWIIAIGLACFFGATAVLLSLG